MSRTNLSGHLLADYIELPEKKEVEDLSSQSVFVSNRPSEKNLLVDSFVSSPEEKKAPALQTAAAGSQEAGLGQATPAAMGGSASRLRGINSHLGTLENKMKEIREKQLRKKQAVQELQSSVWREANETAKAALSTQPDSLHPSELQSVPTLQKDSSLLRENITLRRENAAMRDALSKSQQEVSRLLRVIADLTSRREEMIVRVEGILAAHHKLQQDHEELVFRVSQRYKQISFHRPALLQNSSSLLQDRLPQIKKNYSMSIVRPAPLSVDTDKHYWRKVTADGPAAKVMFGGGPDEHSPARSRQSNAVSKRKIGSIESINLVISKQNQDPKRKHDSYSTVR